MNEKELYWLAGLLEGEGCFSRTKKTGKIFIALEMTDEDIVNKVAKIFGVKYYSITPRKEGYKISYKCRVVGRNAIKLMTLLQPLMGVRRMQKIETLRNEFNPKKKFLSKEQKLEIVSLCKKKELSQSQIGKLFNISRESVNKINAKYGVYSVEVSHTSL